MQKEFNELLKQFKQLQKETASKIDKLSKEKEEAPRKISDENNSLKERLFNESSSYERRLNVPLPTQIQLTGDVKSNLEYFEKMWINHLIVTDMINGNEKVKIAMLLSCIGEEACKILYKMENVYDEKQTAESLLRKLRSHLIPDLNVRFERYLLNTIQQEENESYHAYFIKLGSMVKTCRYEDKEDELLLDKIICSVRDMNIKQKIWLKKNITLEEAIEICKSSEVADSQLKQMGPKLNEICKIRKRSQFQHKGYETCKFCGYKWHKSLKECPARSANCKKCGRIGHFYKVCLKEKEINEFSKEEETNNSEEVEFVLQIEGRSKVMENLIVWLENNKKKHVQFQLDSGAICNVIGRENLSDILNKANIDLEPTNIILKVFGGGSVKTIGSYRMKIERNNKIYYQQFQVVDLKHGPLLSAEACETLGLIKYCNTVQNTKPTTTRLASSQKRNKMISVETPDYPFQTDSTVVIQLPTGKIRGRVLQTPKGNTFYAFQQIPYAAPPVGDLRFREAQPARKWYGILDTMNNTKVCHQGGMSQDDRETEDCLHINVYVPKLKDGECKNLPVLFYIFGGAFRSGHGGYDFYGPELFMDNEVILVTFNYRLGALGFLTTEDNVIPPNLGLKDQLFALKWTYENIEIFGGNPSEITVMAHSSGAASASYLLHSQASAGLFRAMILQSGTSISPGMIQKYGRYFAYKTGEAICQNFGPYNSSTDLVNLLRQLPASIFREFDFEVPEHMRNSLSNSTFIWAPIIESEEVENALVLGPMHENIKNGYINPVPVLMGIVTQEGAEFIEVNFPENEAYKYDENPASLICRTVNVREEYKESMGLDLRSIYTNKTFEEDYEALINFDSSERFVTPMIRHADLQSRYTDIYFYQFSYLGQVGRNRNIKWKGPRMVVHSEELSYIFFDKDMPNFDGFPESDVLTSERVMKMWTNFIKYLNPTPYYDPLLQNVIWPTVNTNNFVYLDIGDDLVLQKDPKEYLAWKRVFDKYVDGPLDVY